MNLSGRAVLLLAVISVCNRGMAQLPNAERTLVRRLCERVFGVNHHLKNHRSTCGFRIFTNRCLTLPPNTRTMLA